MFLLLVGCHSATKENASQWSASFDFDRDEKIDSISYTYSGGAHCCYQLSVHLSASRERVEIPHLIEGGYLVFNLSQPDNFAIADFDKDGRPEIYIKNKDTESENKGVYVDFQKENNTDKFFGTVKYLPTEE